MRNAAANTTPADRRIVHSVTGSSAVRGWAYEADEDGEGGWLAVAWAGRVPQGAYHVRSWVPGLLLATEGRGRSVGRLLNSLVGKGDLAKKRAARGLVAGPGRFTT